MLSLWKAFHPHCFDPLRTELPFLEVQRCPQHDLSENVKNESDFACFGDVLGRRWKNNFWFLTQCFQSGAPGLCMIDASWVEASQVVPNQSESYGGIVPWSIELLGHQLHPLRAEHFQHKAPWFFRGSHSQREAPQISCKIFTGLQVNR